MLHTEFLLPCGHGWEWGCSRNGYGGEVGGRNVDVPSTCRLAHMLDATEHHGRIMGM